MIAKISFGVCSSRVGTLLIYSVLGASLLGSCSSGPSTGNDPQFSPYERAKGPTQDVYMLQQPIEQSFQVTSDSLKNNKFLWEEFTCEGPDFSPHIAWGEVPSETESIAVLSEDLDSPRYNSLVSHWVLWGLPSDTKELPEKASGSKTSDRNLPTGTTEGLNHWKRSEYHGPCPMPKTRYEKDCKPREGFESDPYRLIVYALSKTPSLGSDANREDLLKNIEGSVLASGSVEYKYISHVSNRGRCGGSG